MNGLSVFALGLLLAIITETYCTPGGLGPQEYAGPGEQALVQKNRDAIIRRLPSFMEGPFGPLKALVFKKQVVKGTNYFIKVKMQGAQPRYLHVKIYTGLNNQSKVKDVKFVAQYDPIEYF
ncbi:cystatin-A-like [Saccostrea echinata]|uniref:cystatin-A-like n=1 Tax=Saccostrea echinata TaxID=191078 RepID=UPI002A82B05B|nr:cystatin-A-like [Saccostrea echinata]